MNQVKNEIGANRYSSGNFDLAIELFTEMIFNDDFDDFLTLPAYQHI